MNIYRINVFFGIRSKISLKIAFLHSKIYKIVLCLAAFFVVQFFCGCTQTQTASEIPDESSYIFTMGTAFQLRAIGSGASEAISRAGRIITECDSRISWREDGSVCEIFNSDGQADIDDELLSMMSDVLDMSVRSGGAFDPTVLPVTLLWGFDRLGEDGFDARTMTVPETASVNEALALVDYRNLELDPVNMTLTAGSDGIMMELGAVGKGYALDKAMKGIKDSDIIGCMINAGSSIAVTGTKNDGSLFRIALRDPRGTESDYIGVITATDCCVSTSGDYERFFEKDGIRYHHIIDPATGYPADSGLMQVTVITGSGVTGDALSTACFVLGLEEGMKLAEEYGAKAVFIDTDRNVWYNDPALMDMLDFSGESEGYVLKEYNP